MALPRIETVIGFGQYFHPFAFGEIGEFHWRAGDQYLRHRSSDGLKLLRMNRTKGRHVLNHLAN